MTEMKISDTMEYKDVRREFELAVELGARFCIDSAMLNVDALLRAAATQVAPRAEAVAWMKPEEITGLLSAADDGGEVRKYGRIYAKQYDADMVPVVAMVERKAKS